MTSPARVSSVHQLFLYRRPLHPELFPPKARRGLTQGQYDFEAWLMPAGHVLRFRCGPLTCCELLIDREGNLPLEGAVTGFPCTGEHEFAHQFSMDRVGYSVAVQTENLTENLYRTTYEDMLDYAKQTDAVVHRWNDGESRACMSLLDLHAEAKELHCEGFHLVAANGLVLRTQTVFSCS